ncbi:MAG: HD domain-containing protein, partial [Acidimicrobiales bacterium]
AGALLARRDRLWETRRSRWLPRVAASVLERHQANGDVAFLLEPDLKEGRGGLRDVTTLQAVATVTPVLAQVVGDPGFGGAAAELRSILVATQRLAVDRAGPRARTRLLLQDQDAVAAAMHDRDADALMARVAGAGRALAWASDDGWRRVTSWLEGPGRRSSADRPAGAGLLRRDGEVALDPGAEPALDPSLPVRAAAVAVEQGMPISRQALDRLSAETAAPGEPWPDELRHSLLRLLSAGPPAVAAMETLDQRGLLVRLLPEWAEVRNRPQRNAYHRFTVDRHLLEAAAAAARVTGRVERPDLLVVGALLHDIGKGFPGDHSETGALVAGQIAARMGFGPADAGVISALVRLHLLLPDTATHRDIDDPATAVNVAGAVGDLQTLELLAAVAEADGIATGPAAWGAWKARLVATLVSRVALQLQERPLPAPEPPEPTAGQRDLLERGALALVADGDRLTIVAPDRPGLLSVAAGVLALRGTDVRAALTGPGGSGMALLTFDVAPAYVELPDWDRVRNDLAAALEGRLPLTERLAEQDVSQRQRRSRLAAGRPATRVTVDHAASASATVVEVRAPDAPGTLSRIAGALAGAGLVISSARARTYGAEVIDAFYVLTRDGEALRPGPESDAVVAAVTAAMAPAPEAPRA